MLKSLPSKWKSHSHICHVQVIIVLSRLQELLTMINLPKQVEFSYELARQCFLISFSKAELSAEMEKTERDLKKELATDFVRCGFLHLIVES